MGLGFRVSGLGFWVEGFGLRVQGFGFGAEGFGFGAEGLGFRVLPWTAHCMLSVMTMPSCSSALLRGSRVVIRGFILRVTITTTHTRGLITPLTITTHEPPSQQPQHSHGGNGRAWVLAQRNAPTIKGSFKGIFEGSFKGSIRHLQGLGFRITVL